MTPSPNAPHLLGTALPTPPTLHGPLARFLLHPQAALRDLGHLLAHAGWFVLGHLGPPVAALLTAAILGHVLLARWRARRAAVDAVCLELRSPPAVDPGSAEVFWTNLHALLRPSWRTVLHGRHQVAFEIRAVGERARFTLSAPRSIADHVSRAITAAWPGASVVPSGPAPADRGYRASAGYRLCLARAQWLPIATDRALDPLRSVLGAAAELYEDEEVVVQVVARPASRRRDANAQRAVLGLQGIAAPSPVLRVVGPIVHGILDLVTPGPSTPARPAPRRSEPPHPELRAARQKVQRPCFEAAIRVVVSSPVTGHRAKRHLRSRARAICAGFAEYAAENTLTARRLRHPDAVIASRRLQGGDLYSAPEIAALAHLPLDRDVPGVSRAGARSVAPPPEIHREGKILGDAETGSRRPVALAPPDACHHLHLLGATGSGKSTLLLNLVLGDIASGRGTVVIDPKGALVEDILDRLPEHAIDRTVVIDAEDPEPPTLNVLAGTDVHLVVDQVVGIMHRLFESAWGPRTDDILRAACLTLRQHPGANLSQVPKLLGDPLYRAPLVAAVKDPVLRGFWRWYDGLSEGARSAVIGPVTNKLRAFLLRPFVRAVVGTGTSSFSLAKVLDGGVLLCRLPKGVLGDESTRLLGSLLVAQVWQSVSSRARGGRWGGVCGLYLDECQNFLALPGSLDDILAEARAYGLGLVLAHQHLTQLPADLADAVSANARSKIILSCSPEDARRLERTVAPDLTAHDLSHLGAYQAAARLVVDGEESAAFTFRTRPAPAAVPGRAALVRDRSRESFGLSEQQRQALQLRAEGRWSGRSAAGTPDAGPDGFKLPGLSLVEPAGDDAA
jgi:hypothetical protein